MRNIDNKLAPDHRIIISKGDRGDAVFERELDDLFGPDLKALRFIELGLADAPVLTEAAAQVATGRTEAQDFASRQKVIERFLFDGIDGEARRRSIAERVQLATDVLANIAKAGLALANATITRAKGAEDLFVGLRMPPEGFLHRENIPLLTKRRKGLKFDTRTEFFSVVL